LEEGGVSGIVITVKVKRVTPFFFFFVQTIVFIPRVWQYNSNEYTQ